MMNIVFFYFKKYIFMIKSIWERVDFMKIKRKKLSYEEVMALPKKEHKRPIKQSRLLRFVIKVISFFELKAVDFKFKEYGMEKLGKKEPCLILMNHSSFLDLKIACKVFKRRFNIVCTEDGFIGKNLLMRLLGCIPTYKYLNDPTLVRDIVYAVNKMKQSILMFPEAMYSFDGTGTVIPESLSKCLKLLKVPLVIVHTNGAFARNPLYNNLQLRKVNVSADVTYALSKEEIAAKSVEELNKILNDYFTYDHFKWQQENNIKITEPFRADGLNRILYKCPHCMSEGFMVGNGTKITCTNCKSEYELTEEGFLKGINCETKFNHIPDWYSWERKCVKEEVLNGTYHLEFDCDISVIVDTKCLYDVGSGRLFHNIDGLRVVGCDDKLDFTLNASFGYSLNSDFYWYEINDIICIGDLKARYYCFPKENNVIVAKARLAQEEIYKLNNK